MVTCDKRTEQGVRNAASYKGRETCVARKFGMSVADPGVVRWVRLNPPLTVELIKNLTYFQPIILLAAVTSIEGNIARSVTAVTLQLLAETERLGNKTMI